MATLEFSDVDAATKAIKELRSKEFDGAPLIANFDRFAGQNKSPGGGKPQENGKSPASKKGAQVNGESAKKQSKKIADSDEDEEDDEEEEDESLEDEDSGS